ncbi:MAG: hypothetical protein ACOC1O_05090 [bacterium]
MKSGYIQKFKGKPKEVGISIGKCIGKNRFLSNINKMIEAVDESYGIDIEKMEKESILWLESIPGDYQKELKGISLGSGCPIEIIAQWYYSSMCIDGGCTSFIIRVERV